MNRRLALKLAGALAALIAVPHRARAYCCIAAKPEQPPVCLPDISFPLTEAWNQRCIPFWVSTQGTLFDGASRALVNQSFNVWADEACTDIEFFDAGDTDDTEPGFDNRNPDANKNLVIQLRPDQTSLLMRPERLAVTITAYSVETGEIFDADILLNPNYTFEDIDASSCNIASNRYDLRNVLVHEIGHILGFDHPPVTQTESTMLDTAIPCEVKKRDLDEFDRLGLCTVYAGGEDTRTCAPPANGYDLGGGEDQFRNQCARARGELGEDEGCGCTSARVPQRSTTVSAAILAGLGMLTRRRRRP